MALYVKFDCLNCENENCTGHGLPTTEKVCDGYKHTSTNADRIRQMSDEELAEWLTALEIKAYSRIGYSGNEKRFKAQYLSWLKAPVKEGEG